jgi:ATP-dependent Clp protease adaptor protein ClpS
MSTKAVFRNNLMSNTKGDILEKTREEVDIKTDEPPMYKVIIFNDDFTPKVFVVELLVHLFHKSINEATDLMWRVHRGEKGIAGIYPREIAETKVETGIALARENGFPLKLSMEPDK